MADRSGSGPWPLYANLGADDLTVTVSLTDPTGASAGSGSATGRGSSRYSASITPTPTTLIAGLWTATWKAGSVTKLTQTFTVGDASYGTFGKVLVETARQVARVWDGEVSYQSGTILEDSSLLGGDEEFLSWWVVPEETQWQALLPRRIVSFNGSGGGLTLSDSWSSDLPTGSAYTLIESRVTPRQVEQAIKNVIRGLANKGTVNLSASLTLDSNGNAAIPQGWDRISQVFLINSDGSQTLIAPRDWTCVSGRKLVVAGQTGTVQVRALRFAREPLWPDSMLDIDPNIVIAGAAHPLHMTLAGGSATDVDAHLQRGTAMLQEFGTRLTVHLPKMPLNATPVVD